MSWLFPAVDAPPPTWVQVVPESVLTYKASPVVSKAREPSVAVIDPLGLPALVGGVKSESSAPWGKDRLPLESILTWALLSESLISKLVVPSLVVRSTSMSAWDVFG